LYGSDGQNLYLWLGQGDAKQKLERMELNVQVRNGTGEQFCIKLSRGSEGVAIDSALTAGAVQAALQDGYEIRISLAALRAKAGSPLFLRMDASSNELPMASLPSYGELELKQTAMAAYTY
jgi:hypothetical protein